MKTTIPFLVLLICVIGCSKFGPNSPSTSSTNTSNTTATAAPVIPKQIVDLPATFGKTKDEIKKMISGTPKSEDPWLEYSLDMADLTFMFDKKGNANHCSFRFKSQSVGSASISGTDTAEQLAAMAGVDIKGKTPSANSSLADSYDQQLGGKMASIAIYKVGGSYNNIIITPK